jgi:hypothetical protein
MIWPIGLRRYRWVFVVGCGHSGTTLVAVMLGMHSRIYLIPDETSVFIKGKGLRDTKRRLRQALQQCNKARVSHVCEKTPKHVRHADAILRAFPAAKIIVIVRDPRDVCCSLKRRMGSLRVGIERWDQDNRHALELLKRPNSFKLRYEDLIADPEATLDQLCRFLGLEYEHSMLDYWKHQQDWFGVSERRDTDGTNGHNHAVRRNWQIHQPLMRDRVGVYQRELTVSEISSIECELAPLAREFGYFSE